MTTHVDQLSATLRPNNYSLTRPRKLIFNALQGQEPMTMSELVRASNKLGSIDRASVYRNLAVFEKLGIVQRLQIGWKYKLELSDSFHKHHHHMTCLNCGRITTLHEDQSLETQLRLLAAKNRFKMKGHLLEIQGICEKCPKT